VDGATRRERQAQGRAIRRAEAAGVDGYDALVAAHARALASVSRDIAQAIDALRTAR